MRIETAASIETDRSSTLWEAPTRWHPETRRDSTQAARAQG